MREQTPRDRRQADDKRRQKVYNAFVVYKGSSTMKTPFLLLLSELLAASVSFTGCTSVEQIYCGYDSLCSTASGGMVAPTIVTRSEKTLSCDFGKIISARPVIKVTGPAKAKIKYRTYSNTVDAAESEFELPDLELHERATDLMERITRITATHESSVIQNFRFLDIELSNDVDILRTGANPTSSEASCPHRRDRPSRP